MVDVAGGRPLIEMGSRRTDSDAAVAAARAACLVGFASTSNLEAGRRHGVPTAGTAAHSFTLAHRSEEDAFRSQLTSLGVGTTLLVDTYDTPAAIRMAVALAGELGASGPGAIRLDSGDLTREAHAARALLRELGAVDTKIVASSDLDEYVIETLLAAGAPIDAFGVGTRVVTGSGHPTAGFVYKLVAIAEGEGPTGPLRPVAKRSEDKINVGGRKRAWRVLDADGFATDEHVEACPPGGCLDDPGGPPGGRPLQVPVVVDGKRVHDPSNDDVRAHHGLAMAELRPQWRTTTAGEPAFTARPH
jgi:putative nicotinate phosphoribosyltransferase